MNKTDELTAEVQELVWAMVDEQATDDQIRRLGQLLVEDAEARRIYVTCIQMHVDLQHLFRDISSELPLAFKKAITSRKPAQSKTPLPVVDLPPAGSNAPMTGGVGS